MTSTIIVLYMATIAVTLAFGFFAGLALGRFQMKALLNKAEAELEEIQMVLELLNALSTLDNGYVEAAKGARHDA